MAADAQRPPALVVLPGLDGTGKLLRDFAARLPSDVETRIIVYPADQAMGYEELEKWVYPLLPEDRRYVLLAESFAGPLLLRLAARSPPGLVGAVLCGSFACNPFPMLRWARPLISQVPIKSLPRWLRTLIMWNSADSQRAPPQRDRASAGVPARVLRHRMASLLGADERKRLASLRLPTLVIRGLRDRIVPPAATRRILAAAPQAQLVEIDGPHLLLQTCPRECAAAVAGFLRELTRH